MLNRAAVFFILAVVSLLFSVKSIKFVNITGIINEYYKFLKQSKVIRLFVLFPLFLGASIGFIKQLDGELINNARFIIVHQLISIMVYSLFIQVLLNLLIIIKRNFKLK